MGAMPELSLETRHGPALGSPGGEAGGHLHLRVSSLYFNYLYKQEGLEEIPKVQGKTSLKKVASVLEEVKPHCIISDC